DDGADRVVDEGGEAGAHGGVVEGGLDVAVLEVKRGAAGQGGGVAAGGEQDVDAGARAELEAQHAGAALQHDVGEASVVALGDAGDEGGPARLVGGDRGALAGAVGADPQAVFRLTPGGAAGG